MKSIEFNLVRHFVSQNREEDWHESVAVFILLSPFLAVTNWLVISSIITDSEQVHVFNRFIGVALRYIYCFCKQISGHLADLGNFTESIRQSCSANVSMVTNTVVYDKGSGLPPYLEQEVSASCQHVTYFGTSMKEDN